MLTITTYDWVPEFPRGYVRVRVAERRELAQRGQPGDQVTVARLRGVE